MREALKWGAHAPWQRVAPAHRNWREPTQSNEDPAQPKTTKKKKNIWFFLHHPDHPDSSFMTNTWFPGLTIPRPVKEDIPTSPKLYSDGGRETSMIRGQLLPLFPLCFPLPEPNNSKSSPNLSEKATWPWTQISICLAYSVPKSYMCQ